MLRHMLLVKTKADVSPEALSMARQAFTQAPDIFDGLIRVEWGFNHSPEGLNRGFDLCILMTFTDKQARDAYLPHPDHDRLKVDFLPIIDDIIVVDFDSETSEPY